MNGWPKAGSLRRLGIGVLALTVSLGTVTQLARVPPVLAAAGPTVYYVIGATDVSTGACAQIPVTCDSLRDAVAAANADDPATYGSIRIVLSQTNATYNLSLGSLTLGGMDGQNITVCAGGPAFPTPQTACTVPSSSIIEIHQTTATNIFVTGIYNHLSFTFQNLKLTGGADSTGFGGGALSMGANYNEDVTVTNCNFTSNSAPNGGGGGAINFTSGHNLVITSSTFSS